MLQIYFFKFDIKFIVPKTLELYVSVDWYALIQTSKTFFDPNTTNYSNRHKVFP